MKKKLAVLLAVGMSTVLLSGCASLIRAMYGSNTNTQNQPITTTTTTTTTSESFEPWVTSEPESESESEPSTGSTLVGVTPEYTTATYLSTEAENRLTRITVRSTGAFVIHRTEWTDLLFPYPPILMKQDPAIW